MHQGVRLYAWQWYHVAAGCLLSAAMARALWLAGVALLGKGVPGMWSAECAMASELCPVAF